MGETTTEIAATPPDATPAGPSVPGAAVQTLTDQLAREIKARDKARERLPELRRQTRFAISEARHHDANVNDLRAALERLAGGA